MDPDEHPDPDEEPEPDMKLGPDKEPGPDEKLRLETDEDPRLEEVESNSSLRGATPAGTPAVHAKPRE